ncbi:hypothetical protein SAMN04515665_12061 [Blastococcus sp. DSM 46786]|uniref:hypothetical protein n=1 Tax=Blastococcus sp. DSM 46786 TaxID=1798227 RepID=UPI0008CFD5ED|nr:hypothetical protein [Blastococcus sp. DSM 46786]SEL82413.1 hypothetical protein SAMN04515665_12061 [Blastococcus sp. DSM 46786]
MHLHLPRLPVPAVLLSLVYLAAVAVAISAPGQHALAGLLVLTGLVARWVVRARRSGRAAAPVALAVAGTTTAVDAVLPADPAAATAHATAA